MQLGRFDDRARVSKAFAICEELTKDRRGRIAGGRKFLGAFKITGSVSLGVSLGVRGVVEVRKTLEGCWENPFESFSACYFLSLSLSLSLVSETVSKEF